MRYLLISICLLTCLGPAMAQSADPFLQDSGLKWLNASAYTLEVAALMPETDYDYKPADEEMSFWEQLLHLAANINWLTSSYLQGEATQSDLKRKDYSKEEIINILTEVYMNAGKAMLTLPAAALEEPVEFFAGPMNRRRIVMLLHDHQTHHRGQLVVYLRMKGVKPPAYRGW